MKAIYKKWYATPTVHLLNLSLSCTLIYILSKLSGAKVNLGHLLEVKALSKVIINVPDLKGVIFSVAALSLLFFSYYVIQAKTSWVKYDIRSINTSNGFLSVVLAKNNVDMHRIVDVVLKRGILDRILKMSMIEIHSNDKTHPVLKIRGLCRDDADELFNHINEYAMNSLVEDRMRRLNKKKDH